MGNKGITSPPAVTAYRGSGSGRSRGEELGAIIHNQRFVQSSTGAGDSKLPSFIHNAGNGDYCCTCLPLSAHRVRRRCQPTTCPL